MKKNTAQNAATFFRCSTASAKSVCLGRSLKNTKISQLKRRCTLAVGRLLASVDRDLKALVKASIVQEMVAIIIIMSVTTFCVGEFLVALAEHGGR